MTTVTFHSDGSRITGFTVEGHSGFADEGEDILCAAITSAIRLTECAVNDVLGLCASVKVSDKTANISFRLPGGLAPSAEETCQTLLASLMVYFAELHDEYPNFIEVTEEG